MKCEKMCYAFVGCVVAGSVVQNNLNLSWTYFPLISLGLWAICVGVQWYSFRWTQSKMLQQEGQKIDKHNEELERIISTFENCSSQQVEQIKKEIDLLKDSHEVDNKKLLELLRALDESISQLKIANENGIKDVVASISNAEEKEKKILQEMVGTLSNSLNEHSMHIGKQLETSQDKCFGQLSSLQKSLESICNNTLEMIKLENDILSSQNTNKQEVEACINNSINAIITNNKDLLGEVIQNVSKIGVEIDAINELRDSISNALSELEEAVNNGKNEVVREMAQCITTLLSTYKESGEALKHSITEIASTLLDVKKDINQSSENSIGEMKSVTDDVKGSLSNLQDAVETDNRVLSNIEKLDGESRDLIENANIKLKEVIGEISNCANKVSENLTDGIDKQFEVISREESVLQKYDEVLRLINDEVVVKMVNDSNNLLVCMKDCYNLLESIRRAKK